MSQAPEETSKPKSGLLKGALWGVALLGVAAVVYIMAQASINPRQTTSLKSLAKGEMAKLIFPAEAGPAPATSFQDADGKPVRLADFKGKVVVVNLWATWCGPCVIEMPTLAKLAAAYEGQPVAVVAVSVDGERDAEKARLFIAKHAPLVFYRDPKLKLPYDFKPAAVGMPTTVIFGKDGVERARLAGGADWAGPEARAVIDKVLAES
ncbi:MAG: TlpA disulfide reductase family protein [Phenylobacterium sp.]|uniref:TlpA family protein disulfide reductase n=1 Tax=Phenylobacterium sp. TaxID=1871053 RepID=UPI00271F2FB9|nr:TlpA disulfide reductase family protein [Phenylobacterium sp.]MDO8911461.1 TlpA disulfide reductase family protein [Phenylobacterium sp.]MDO9245704.1 TlpA disulfide reductase family protein [Phenylobacterium sp.]MDP2011499.1 TlpA disulfide reductase family protein [Phenylobacterium sp.]MDP3098921.1 TlpA disulfide reductase family protein [Phenylobacterium sp.]MDP3632245.1 TlpA disulfide reductase family protein [Phenylobacterium sp.]